MSRRGLYQLEMMYSRTLEVWDRSKAKNTASKISFRPAFLLPPEELPIQGLMMPEPSERKHEEERDGGRRSRRNFANARKTFIPKRRFTRNIRAERKPRKFGGDRRREKALKTESKAISFLCRCCDYRDRLTGKCLVIRLGGECPYVNGVYSSTPKKPMKVPVRSR